MDNIVIPAGERTFGINFDFSIAHFTMEGESYPEDTARFFGPIYQSLRSFVQSEYAGPIKFDLDLRYFNSSSAKALMNLFQLLDDAAIAGKKVSVNWFYYTDDDTMQEFGDDFSQDFQALEFQLCPKTR